MVLVGFELTLRLQCTGRRMYKYYLTKKDLPLGLKPLLQIYFLVEYTRLLSVRILLSKKLTQNPLRSLSSLMKRSSANRSNRMVFIRLVQNGHASSSDPRSAPLDLKTQLEKDGVGFPKDYEIFLYFKRRKV